MVEKNKKVYIIHAWGETGNSIQWYNWLNDKLSEKGFEVKSFDMPNTENPKIEEWVRYLEENVKIDLIDEHTWFVGHSIGCQTILRFLEKLPKHKRVAGCVFVAPWLNLINLKPEEILIAHPWITADIHFGRILEHTTNFLSIFSDDDPNVHQEEADKFRDKFGSKILIKERKGHFEEVGEILEVLGFIK